MRSWKACAPTCAPRSAYRKRSSSSHERTPAISGPAGIATGGACGSLLRTLVGSGYEGVFPVPTLRINLFGAAALAILYARQHRIHLRGRYLYMVGFCASFTAVSLFSFEIVPLAKTEHTLAALTQVRPGPEGAMTRALLGAGFCGALTTFSTFILETAILLRVGERRGALFYVTVTLSLCCLASLSGFSFAALYGRPA